MYKKIENSSSPPPPPPSPQKKLYMNSVQILACNFI
jgi:hypothetical protein